ncbi:MAG: hypothetical protein WDW36_009975 [Sanguina aurantia]
MTYMYSGYEEVPALDLIASDQAATGSNGSSSKQRYSLFRYLDTSMDAAKDGSFTGVSVPVLFLPGSGGSYKQGRALAGESLRLFERIPGGRKVRLAWYLADTRQELSAFDGRLLARQTRFVMTCLHYLKQRYSLGSRIDRKDPPGPGSSSEGSSGGGGGGGGGPGGRGGVRNGPGGSGSGPPGVPGVILVGHSMGGVVGSAALAQAAADGSLGPSLVSLLLTLATPHQRPPLPTHPSLAAFYTNLRSLPTPATPIISLSGGSLDFQVHPSLSALTHSIHPSPYSFSAVVSDLPGIWISARHDEITWCNQLVRPLSLFLMQTVQPLGPVSAETSPHFRTPGSSHRTEEDSGSGGAGGSSGGRSSGGGSSRGMDSDVEGVDGARTELPPPSSGGLGVESGGGESSRGQPGLGALAGSSSDARSGSGDKSDQRAGGRPASAVAPYPHDHAQHVLGLARTHLLRQAHGWPGAHLLKMLQLQLQPPLSPHTSNGAAGSATDGTPHQSGTSERMEAAAAAAAAAARGDLEAALAVAPQQGCSGANLAWYKQYATPKAVKGAVWRLSPSANISSAGRLHSWDLTRPVPATLTKPQRPSSSTNPPPDTRHTDRDSGGGGGSSGSGGRSGFTLLLSGVSPCSSFRVWLNTPVSKAQSTAGGGNGGGSGGSGRGGGGAGASLASDESRDVTSLAVLLPRVVQDGGWVAREEG